MVEVKIIQSIIFIIIINGIKNSYSPLFKSAMKVEYPCKDNTNIVITVKFDHNYVKEESNRQIVLKNKVKIYFYVWVNERLDNGTEIKVKFDKDAAVFLRGVETNISNVRFKLPPDTINNIYTLEFFNNTQTEQEIIMVRGEEVPNHPPYITSLKINGVEKCRRPDLEFWKFQWPVFEYLKEAPNKFCGRRKLKIKSSQVPLIVNGSATSEGWWPWHAAIYRIEKGTSSYYGGGTLISEYLILTAAHCVSKNGIKVNAEILRVVLGKYSLYATDTATQSIEVFEVVLHDEFQHKKLNNDIALLKLMTAAVYNNYVQPACLWFDGIYDVTRNYEITGTVVGWGFDRTDQLSNNLLQATMPLVPNVVCVLFIPTFYYNILNNKKFCAGSSNGTAPCNGDSGGGFVVFVKDPPVRFVDTLVEPISHPGAWYVKGIVSTTLARADAPVCDPNGYTVFTDVAKYTDWIQSYMHH